jgi:L-erythro-3,5-diaminohexanoate dehydrogenase
MKTEHAPEIVQQLGADRVIAPAGALPQPAERVDASGPVRPYEFEVDVERLCLDSTSFRNIRERSDGDPARMADRILEVVAQRGKMHNPETDSGGVALGTVTAVGELYGDPPEPGQRIVTLASLTLTPLRLTEVVRIDPADPQVEVRGTAYVCDRSAWGPVPEDLPLETVLAVYDVYGAGSLTKELVSAGDVVCVLGAGHAGKVALAAARDAGAGTLVAADVDPEAVALVERLSLCDVGVATDVRDPLAALGALREAGAPPADLTVVVVNATRCEPTAIALTKDTGTVLFFSMATTFSTAALTADGMSSGARLLIGNGYTPDVGAYALDLVRSTPALREALGA